MSSPGGTLGNGSESGVARVFPGPNPGARLGFIGPSGPRDLEVAPSIRPEGTGGFIHQRKSLGFRLWLEVSPIITYGPAEVSIQPWILTPRNYLKHQI